MNTQIQPQIIKSKDSNVNALPVFIVEDNPMYSYMLTFRLAQEFGFKISNFDSGKDCLLNLGKHLPAIIIIDYKLKNMDGINTLQYVKKHYPKTYVIVLSEHKNIRTTIEIIKKGAFDYIPKNHSSIDELIFSIQKVIVEINTTENLS